MKDFRIKNLKENGAQSAHAESTHKGDNWHSKDVTQTLTTTKTRVAYGNSHLAWRACKHKVHINSTRGISFEDVPLVEFMYLVFTLQCVTSFER